jgi:hypothetical protein
VAACSSDFQGPLYELLTGNFGKILLIYVIPDVALEFLCNITTACYCAEI